MWQKQTTTATVSAVPPLRVIIRATYTAMISGSRKWTQKDKIVGRVTFADGTAQEFTDPHQYLQTIKEELPLRNTTGFKHETLSEDPEIKKAVDDILLEFCGRGKSSTNL